jgi:hypothetical protein
METNATIERKIRESCAELTKTDAKLLERGISERTLTCRLAVYLQKRFQEPYFVDCEYNKIIADDTDIPKHLSNWNKKWVMPDIIIHRRTREPDGNLVVIEAKRRVRGSKSVNKEREKIRQYMREPALKYQYGYVVLFDKCSAAPERING